MQILLLRQVVPATITRIWNRKRKRSPRLFWIKVGIVIIICICKNMNTKYNCICLNVLAQYIRTCTCTCTYMNIWVLVHIDSNSSLFAQRGVFLSLPLQRRIMTLDFCTLRPSTTQATIETLLWKPNSSNELMRRCLRMLSRHCVPLSRATLLWR